MSTKKMAASIIAIMMFAVIFVTTAAAFTAPNANGDRVEFEYSESDCDGLYVNERNCDRQVNIVHKDLDWNVIDDSENGVLTYQLNGDGILTYSYNNPMGNYELVVIMAETAGTGEYPQYGSIALTGSSGTADISALLGWVNDGGDYDGSVYGAKIWYVPVTLFDEANNKFTGWEQSNMLFEEELIVPTTLPTLRIYGEDSYDAAFPYNDPEGPFDPTNDEAPGKDFVVFNPAYISEYAYGGVITVSGSNGREKVFVKQWYVPEYPEPRGDVWAQQDTVYSADIVTEYSFMLLNAQNMPEPGTAQQGTGAYWTNFWLPIGSDGAQIGLDSFVIEPGSGTNRMVQLKAVGDFNDDGMKDIDITTRDTLLIDHLGWFQFLDHAIHVTDISYDSAGHVVDTVVDLYYIGNRNIGEVTTDDLIVANLHLDVGGQQVIAGRHTHTISADPSFTLPWYLEVQSIGLQGVYVKVGRLLHMGETFFVDGAEYDIAMIYGPNTDDFKYITIRNPTPKLEDVWLDDLSILKESVDICDPLPMLPPFNMVHTIVDDIGIPHTCPTDGNSDLIYGDYIQDEPIGIDDCADEVEKRLVYNQPPFMSYFVEEMDEERFRTNLLEILDEDTPESWDMLCMWTLPWSYTAMVYPNVGDMLCNGVPIKDADFIVTTSGPKESLEAVCPGNLNGDTVVDIDDLFVVLNNWGASGGIADITDDGTVDIDDLFVVLNNWGNCP